MPRTNKNTPSPFDFYFLNIKFWDFYVYLHAQFKKV